jgi:hypothetical protein
MNVRLALIVPLVAFVAAPTRPESTEWNPPLGIPMPPFGIVEVAPPSPSPWDSPRAGFYYVEACHAAATDEGNPYGSPAKPRLTIPAILPAGAVVELHGRYARRHSYPHHIVTAGTAARPVFIRGTPGQRPIVTGTFHITGSYFVVESIDFAFESAVTGALRLGAPAHHAVLRHCDVRGNRNGGGIGVASYRPEWSISDVVIVDNVIHDNGDVNASYDQDVHGITVNARVSRLWIVDNEISRNSGTGVQVNAGSGELQPTVHHIYLGRNVSHHNKQAGLSTKQSVDTIFSQNTIYGHRASNSSPGQGMNGKYAPERAWYIFNHIYDNDYGITIGSAHGAGVGRDIYVVGNVIHDIHYHPNPYTTFNPRTAWASAAIMMADGARRYVVGNTIADVDGGIYAPSGGSVTIANNIISRVAPAGQHVFVETSATAAASSIDRVLFDAPARMRWGTSNVLSLGEFRRRFRDQCQRCVEGDPAFDNALHIPFGLQPRSPARAAAVLHDVYRTFSSLYGIDIATDLDGVTPPSGSSWHLGARQTR